MPEKLKLYTLLGDYPNTAALKKGEVASDFIDFAFADVKVSNTAFKPLVREAKFDLGELAIVTYLQAKTYGKPYALIPATVLGRGQHHTIAYNPERGRLGARFPRGRLQSRSRKNSLDHVRGSASRRIQGPGLCYARARRQEHGSD